MTQAYITTKIVTAWEEERDGQEGFAVRYPDGYLSWCPRETFLRTSRPINGEEAALIQSNTPNLDDAT